MKNEDGSNEIDCKEKTKKIKKERKTLFCEKGRFRLLIVHLI